MHLLIKSTTLLPLFISIIICIDIAAYLSQLHPFCYLVFFRLFPMTNEVQSVNNFPISTKSKQELLRKSKSTPRLRGISSPVTSSSTLPTSTLPPTLNKRGNNLPPPIIVVGNTRVFPQNIY